jgi:tellurium resistance protein TerZ
MPFNLKKGDRIDLKSSTPSLQRVLFGCRWEVGSEVDIDTDASCLLINSEGEEVEQAVYHENLTAANGAVIHSGDNLTGGGDGDDETITVDFSRIADEVMHLFFVITSYDGIDFNKIAGASCRVVDAANGTELATFDLSGQGDHSALIAARLYRDGGTWRFHAIGQAASGREYRDLLGPIRDIALAGS